VSKVAQLLKGESSHWVNQEHITATLFEWQDEYCALSVSESRVEAVRRYIERQEEHHKKKALKEEYEEILKGMSPQD
jgi:REP element-mobilizing transposase RayT